MSEVRCGIEGLPPVVVKPVGRLRVGSTHHVEAASLAGTANCLSAHQALPLWPLPYHFLFWITRRDGEC